VIAVGVDFNVTIIIVVHFISSTVC